MTPSTPRSAGNPSGLAIALSMVVAHLSLAAPTAARDGTEVDRFTCRLQGGSETHDAPSSEAATAATAVAFVGSWRAELASPGGALRFGLEITGAPHGDAARGTGSALRAVILNHPERIEVERVALAGDTLRIEFPHYDSVVSLRRSGDRPDELEGSWHKSRGAGKPTRMACRARRAPSNAAADESTTRPGDAEPMAFPARWRVQFSRDPHPAVGQFHIDANGRATGTFATTLGDYRYLAGTWHDQRLELSCFDGAHAFLFRAQGESTAAPSPPTKLIGDFWSSASWHETWTAVPDPNAELPDAWSLTEATAAPDHGSPLGGLSFPDADGTVQPLDSPAFTGPARLLVVFGSWCPNCHDEFAYLAELHRRYGARGLRIQGLAFEHDGGDGDPGARGRRQVKRFAARHGVEFPLLIAGLSQKARASQAMPLLDAVRSYPTTLFLDGRNRVVAIHTGFRGPATGEGHATLRREFETRIERLLPQ